MKWLRSAMVLQIVFFGTWWIYLSESHKGGQEMWLETVPVDPRDLISGNYVSLSYNLTPEALPNCKKFLAQNDIDGFFVELVPAGKQIRTKQGAVEVWKAADCSLHLGTSPSTTFYAKGRLEKQSWRRRLIFGIEKFFVNEGSPLRYAQSGSVVAKVSLNSSHQLRIIDLVEISEPIGPPLP